MTVTSASGASNPSPELTVKFESAYIVGSPGPLTWEHLVRHVVESPLPENNWRPRRPTFYVLSLEVSMARQHDQRGSSRKEDWLRFLNALIGRCGPNERRRHDNAVLNYILTLAHVAWNIVVEELRRWGINVKGG